MHLTKTGNILNEWLYLGTKQRIIILAYNQRQKCWEGCLFFSPLPPPHPPLSKLLLMQILNLHCIDVYNIGFGGELQKALHAPKIELKPKESVIF